MESEPQKRKKPKLTDAERHKRFVETAKKVDASEEKNDFDKVFKRVVRRVESNSN